MVKAIDGKVTGQEAAPFADAAAGPIDTTHVLRVGMVHDGRTVRRLTQLVPDDATQRRDLGVCLVHADHPGAAIGHLEAYLRGDPADGEVVAAFLQQAHRHLAKWN